MVRTKIKMIGKLIKAGSDTEIKDVFGSTPLHLAASYKRMGMFRDL